MYNYCFLFFETTIGTKEESWLIIELAMGIFFGFLLFSLLFILENNRYLGKLKEVEIETKLEMESKQKEPVARKSLIQGTPNNLRKAFLAKERAGLYLDNLEKMRNTADIDDAGYLMLKEEYTPLYQKAISDIDLIKNELKKQLDVKSNELSDIQTQIKLLDIKTKLNSKRILTPFYTWRVKTLKKKQATIQNKVSKLRTFLAAEKSHDIELSSVNYFTAFINKR